MIAPILIGTGGCFGAISRYLLGGVVVNYFGNAVFPLGTLFVNLIGCFLIGLLSGLAENHGLISVSLRLFLVTGFLGGFTTFSAFGYETVLLLREGNAGMAFLNVGLSVFAGLLAVWLGLKLT